MCTVLSFHSSYLSFFMHWFTPKNESNILLERTFKWSIQCMLHNMPYVSIEFWMISCKKELPKQPLPGLECKCRSAGVWFELLLWYSWFYGWFDMFLNACFGILSIIKFIKTVLDYTWLENSCKMAAKWTEWTRGRRKTTKRMPRTTQSWTRDKCWMI